MKAKITLIILALGISYSNFSQSIGINQTGSSPHPSAMLDVESISKGFLPPRMTTSQREAITNPADGLVIFNITTGCLNYFYSSLWYEKCGSVIPFVCGTSNVRFVYNGTYVSYGTVVSANNRCWLDRNLGASQVATNSTDATAYGDLFQWGRLDDGHEIRTSSTTTTLSNNDVPGHENFILTLNSPYDWRSPQNDNLWQGVNGVNNPCPTGYRLPTREEWDTERLSWSTDNAAGAFNSPLKLTLSGLRSHMTGFISNSGSVGYYWSSTISGTNSKYLYISTSNTQMMDYYRARGFSVRCIKD